MVIRLNLDDDPADIVSEKSCPNKIRRDVMDVAVKKLSMQERAY